MIIDHACEMAYYVSFRQLAFDGIVVSFLSLSVGSSHLAQSVKDGVPCLLKPANSVTSFNTPFEFTVLPYIYRISDVCIQHAFKCNILP